MPKMKTKASAKKRFKKVGKSKKMVKVSSGYKRHLLTKKSRKRKRHLKSIKYVNKVDLCNIKVLLPY